MLNPGQRNVRPALSNAPAQQLRNHRASAEPHAPDRELLLTHQHIDAKARANNLSNNLQNSNYFKQEHMHLVQDILQDERNAVAIEDKLRRDKALLEQGKHRPTDREEQLAQINRQAKTLNEQRSQRMARLLTHANQNSRGAEVQEILNEMPQKPHLPFSSGLSAPPGSTTQSVNRQHNLAAKQLIEKEKALREKAMQQQLSPQKRG